ncbi:MULTISPECIES: hypothetical protein [Pseudomonas]|nr:MULTISPECIES: hypothetical protein [Pseudomonas]
MNVNTTLAAWRLIAVGDRFLRRIALSGPLTSRRVLATREVSHGQ